MVIIEMTGVSNEIVAAFQRLIPQLTEHSLPPTREDLAAMVTSPATAVFLARNSAAGPVVGSATLAIAYSPTGQHGWIEDVVVEGEMRGQGLGKALTRACLEKAKSLGLHQVFLTSRPSRVAANQMYQSMGFIQRETNVYCYDLD